MKARGRQEPEREALFVSKCTDTSFAFDEGSLTPDLRPRGVIRDHGHRLQAGLSGATRAGVNEVVLGRTVDCPCAQSD